MFFIETQVSDTGPFRLLLYLYQHDQWISGWYLSSNS